MTIRKGEDWGVTGAAPAGLEIVRGDAELFALLNRGPGPAAEGWPAAVGLLAGDLARTVGASGDPARLAAGAGVVVLPVDVGIAAHDGGRHVFAAHAVARRSWWRGPVVAVANAQFVGEWDVAPRSHPNDGWLDVTEVDEAMALRQRWAARRRLPTATHLPHPHIRTRRVHEAQWEFARPLDLWLDGQRVGRTRRLQVSVVEDALTVCI